MSQDVFSPDSILFYWNVGLIVFVVRFLLDWKPARKNQIVRLWEGRWIQLD
jgi:hypothetical protein